MIQNVNKELKRKSHDGHSVHTVCPRSSDPFYTVTYYIKWVTTSWKDGNFSFLGEKMFALYDYDVLVVSKNTHK